MLLGFRFVALATLRARFALREKNDFEQRRLIRRTKVIYLGFWFRSLIPTVCLCVSSIIIEYLNWYWLMELFLCFEWIYGTCLFIDELRVYYCLIFSVFVLSFHFLVKKQQLNGFLSPLFSCSNLACLSSMIWVSRIDSGVLRIDFGFQEKEEELILVLKAKEIRFFMI